MKILKKITLKNTNIENTAKIGGIKRFGMIIDKLSVFINNSSNMHIITKKDFLNIKIFTPPPTYISDKKI